MNIPPERRLGSVRTVAELCDVSAATVYRWLADESIKPEFPRPIQLGSGDKSQRFDLACVQHWIEARALRSAADGTAEARRQKMRSLRARREARRQHQDGREG
jgi:predicted DNA-binding transcriptional regulator AlpA